MASSWLIEIHRRDESSREQPSMHPRYAELRSAEKMTAASEKRHCQGSPGQRCDLRFDIKLES